MGWDFTIADSEGNPPQPGQVITYPYVLTGDGTDIIRMPANPVDADFHYLINTTNDSSVVTLDGNGNNVADFVNEVQDTSVPLFGAYLALRWYFADPDNDGVGVWHPAPLGRESIRGLEETTAPIIPGVADTQLPLTQHALTPVSFGKWWFPIGGDLEYAGVDDLLWIFDWNSTTELIMANNTEFQWGIGIKLQTGTGSVFSIEKHMAFQSSRAATFRISQAGVAIVKPKFGDTYRAYARDDTLATPGIQLSVTEFLLSIET